MVKENKTKFRFMAAFSVVAILVTAGLWLHPVFAQSPGVQSGKADAKPPIASATPVAAKLVVYKVANGQIM